MILKIPPQKTLILKLIKQFLKLAGMTRVREALSNSTLGTTRAWENSPRIPVNNSARVGI
jgi:hypothetical protein